MYCNYIYDVNYSYRMKSVERNKNKILYNTFHKSIKLRFKHHVNVLFDIKPSELSISYFLNNLYVKLRQGEIN